MVVLAGKIFTSEFWQYAALISDPLAFSMQAFAPVILREMWLCSCLVSSFMVMGYFLGYLLFGGIFI